ncbi:hypothetical protein JQ760_028370 (plasmid) [Klebsiella pneumoniae]|uniref:hypothetical protein n=1 Tax=Klebsiella pneumoniae TaxID=573 RepID=UPI001FABD1D4|nr:hypothetical protein [Klebsiella pneumoniae]MCI8108421.1 hypothetical protein [Klebsiella pneumoniae]
MKSMTFEDAKKKLLENAIGRNDYAKLTNWQELSEAAEQEICFAEERIRELQDVATQANEDVGF